MHVWDEYWDLRVGECPCDVHFLEFLEERGTENAVIYHFGSGGHHVVGLECSRAGRGNVVMSITASPREYDGYVKLLTAKPEVSHSYVCYFGDIYTFNGRLMPEFDIVTIFHLCEFRSEKNDAYGGITDEEVLRRLVARTKPGGSILFYNGSFAWDNAKTIVEKAVADGLLEPAGEFKTLPIYRKISKA